jgi:hypothetical protein
MKLISALCASALALATTSTAQATTYTPAGTFVFQGATVLTKGPPITCPLKITIVVPNAAPDAHGTASHGHVATATPVLGGVCLATVFNGTPYPVTFDGTNISLQNVLMTFFSPGSCSGSITGAWGGNTATPRTISVNASLAGSKPPSCTIVGILTQTSGAPLSIANP